MMRSKARWVLAVVMVTALAAVGAAYAYTLYLSHDHYSPGVGRIDAYSIGAQPTLLTIHYSVGAGDVGGEATVREDARAVTVKVNISVFQPGTGRFKKLDAYPMETTVTLKEPLGERLVIDGGTGNTIAPSPHP